MIINNNIKKKIKSIPVFFKANAFIKARQLKCGLFFLDWRYRQLAVKQGVEYNEDHTYKYVRTHLHNSYPNLPTSDLRVFWMGANRDQDESGFLQALRKMVTVFEFKNHEGKYGQWFWDKNGNVNLYDPDIIRKNNTSLLSQIREALKQGPIHLLFAQTWANFISKETIQEIRDMGIPFINISMDDRLPDNWYHKEEVRMGAVGLAPVTDLVLTTSSETCLWYAVEKCPAIFWPLASSPEIFEPSTPQNRDIDVLFIGNKYGVRESIVQGLQKHGIHIECYGSGWPNGSATAEQSASLFKRSKIILGIGTIGHCNDVYTLKLRDFDAPMSGGLYITHRNPDLVKLYEEGKEIECYSTIDECAEKINFYLNNPDELSKVAFHGFQKAKSRDTWEYRLRKTFQDLGFLPR